MFENYQNDAVLYTELHAALARMPYDFELTGREEDCTAMYSIFQVSLHPFLCASFFTRLTLTCLCMKTLTGSYSRPMVGAIPLTIKSGRDGSSG